MSQAPAAAEPLADVLARLRAVQTGGRTRRLPWRLEQLRGIERLIGECEGEIAAALAQDLGRGAAEAWLGDIASTAGEAAFARKHVRRWMRRKTVRLPLNQLPGSGWVQYEPLGVVLVIGPWNYPVYLTLAPLVAAVAAGNCAVVKPSEIAPATSALLARLIPRYLDREAVAVIEGDAGTTQELLALGFDHAFFTGGSEVGSKIMAAAAPTLTPVTLELGGKSPVIVTSDADLDVAARRIAMIKLLNSGQTCIAPDYVLVERSVRAELVDRLVTTLARFRGDSGGDGLPIVNDRQFDRIAGYLKETRGTVTAAGPPDRESRTMHPAIIVNPDPNEPVMSGEIFGPVLPVIEVADADEAIRFVRDRPKPLALYVFTGSRSVARRIVDAVPAGGAVVNHVAMHCLVPQLPFGGIGPSGMGAYHGEWGFQQLSHRKSVLSKAVRPDPKLLYPPYTRWSLAMLRRLF